LLARLKALERSGRAFSSGCHHRLGRRGAGVGEPGYGVPDGLITAADINYYVNLWTLGCP